MTTKELTLTTGLDYSDRAVLQTLRQTIAADATEAEFQMFVAFCQSTGLNPYKKEIWFIKTKGYTKRDGTRVDPKVQMMTGINGFYAIANKHPAYDGMAEPDFEERDGRPVKCTVRVWRKDRRFPSVGVARWEEYFPGTTKYGNSIWETKPFVMLGKVAESIALRKAFPQELNGLYTQEEMPSEYAAPVLVEAPKAVEPAKITFADGDDLPPDWLTKKPQSSLEQEIQNAIDGEDIGWLSDYVITTRCSFSGMSLRDAVSKDRAKLEKNISKLNKLDKLAVSAFLELYDVPPEDIVFEYAAEGEGNGE